MEEPSEELWKMCFRLVHPNQEEGGIYHQLPPGLANGYTQGVTCLVVPGRHIDQNGRLYSHGHPKTQRQGVPGAAKGCNEGEMEDHRNSQGIKVVQENVTEGLKNIIHN